MCRNVGNPEDWFSRVAAQNTTENPSSTQIPRLLIYWFVQVVRTEFKASLSEVGSSSSSSSSIVQAFNVILGQADFILIPISRT